MVNRRILILTFLIILLIPLRVGAQESGRLEISSIDAGAFPEIKLRILAANSDGTRPSTISDAVITEGGNQVEAFEESTAQVGIEVIFVIDANSTINVRDERNGPTRREKVRDAINHFATLYMDPSQRDRVTIIVPGAEGGEIILERTEFQNAVPNVINFYDPEDPGDTPLNEMMNQAIELAEENRDEGRYQAVVFFSDAGQIGDQLDYEALIQRSNQISLPIYGVILGQQADNNEIANVTALSDPTGGSFVHQEALESLDPIFATLQQQGTQFEVTFQSRLSDSGVHTISVERTGVRAEKSVELEISPPEAVLAIDNSQPIKRVLSEPEAAITSAEPKNQPLVAQITWPDGHQRQITSASLLVDGEAVLTIAEPELVSGNQLAFDWDISALDEGIYQLVVSLSDELGLESESDALPMAIEVAGAAPPEAENNLAATPTVVATVVQDDEAGTFIENLGAVGLIVAGVSLFAVLLLFVVVIMLIRRGRGGAQPVAATPQFQAVAPAPQVEHDATQIIRPAFVARQHSNAYLEPLENAPEHSGAINLGGSNVAIGRDPNLAQIVFGDKSVSRLHARIMESGGTYRLYDEGSASGTYLNYEQVSLTPQQLKDNDDVHIGRVHLRFHMAAVQADDDSTQVMPAPQFPGQPRQEPQDDGLSTQPYMPQGPGPAASPQQPGDQGQGGDEDDISTQPYMPHSPKR